MELTTRRNWHMNCLDYIAHGPYDTEIDDVMDRKYLI